MSIPAFDARMKVDTARFRGIVKDAGLRAE
jgi:hypothetical protein